MNEDKVRKLSPFFAPFSIVAAAQYIYEMYAIQRTYFVAVAWLKLIKNT